ncbi:MAG: PBS lyase, partial [Planctomycetes bacterium]|nr:PBS lyase [Planctomycetota bacterium]
MTTNNYTEPVSSLLTYGSARNIDDWSVYLELGLTEEHIPELIRMSGDEKLRHAYWESNEFWAPLHARRTLGMLRATEAIPALIDLLYQADDYDGEKITEEMPEIFALIGES